MNMSAKGKTHISVGALTKGSRFVPTRWSLLLAAADSKNNTQARRALNELCGIYWPPLYAYLRRGGLLAAEAEDLIQGFFTLFLERNDLAHIDRAKGKFRSLLLASLNHFLANEWDKQRAKKRGSGRRPLSLDTHDAERQYRAEPVDNITPELLFNRRWALTMLDNVLKRLRQEYVANDKERLFEGIKNSLTMEPDTVTYAQLAVQLSMTDGAVKTAAHRLRRRYQVLLRDEIAQTVADPESVDEEIRDLFNYL